MSVDRASLVRAHVIFLVLVLIIFIGTHDYAAALVAYRRVVSLLEARGGVGRHSH